MAIGLSRGQISNTAAAIYSCPSGKTASIKTIVLFNSNTTAEVIKIYAVPNNGGSVGTATDANQILSISLSSGNTFEFTPGYPLELNAQNDTIQANSTTASKVNYVLGGLEQ